MDIGLGISAFTKCMQSNGIDGIGVHTQELYQRLKQNTDITVNPVAFGHYATPLPIPNTEILPRFAPLVARSILTGQAFPETRQLEGKIDLFHAPDHYIPKLDKIPVIATIHDAIPLAHPEWVSFKFRLLMSPAFKRSGRWATHIITISEYSRQQIIEYFGIPGEKISVIPNGVDERWFKPTDQSTLATIRAKHDLPENYFINVGTLQPRKNIERLIEAHQSLPFHQQKDYPLVLVGRSGWGCKALVSKLEALDSQSNIRWLRHVTDDELTALVKGALALVFPSLSEGFGLPVIEAFASELPVIASNTTSLPEVAGDAALLIEPTDTVAITNAMLKMVNEPGLRNTLKIRGLKKARHYSWDATAEQTIAVYKSVLEK